jgi:DNA mismatch repair protein MutS
MPAAVKIRDASKATPGLAQYLEIKSQYPDALLFFQMGDFYELFFEDAQRAAEALNITLTKRGMYEGEPVPMCGVPLHARQAYLARLLKQGFHITICDQTNSAPADGKRLVTRRVTRVLTPGTVVEEAFLSEGENTFLLCLFPCGEGQWVGASADVSTGDFLLQRMEGPLEDTSLWALKPSEVLVPFELVTDPALTFLKSVDIPLTTWPRQKFSLRQSEAVLKRFFNLQTLSGLGELSTGDVIVAGTLVSYVLSTHQEHVFLKPPRFLLGKKFLTLDKRTQQNLELLPTAGTVKGSSVLEAIDRTVTSAGKRLLKKRLMLPIRCAQTLKARLDAVSVFVDDAEKRKRLRELLGACPDLERPLARLVGQKGVPKDLGQVRDVLRCVRDVEAALPSESPSALVMKWKVMLEPPRPLLETLEGALEDCPASMMGEEAFLRAGALPEMDAAFAAQEDLRHQIEKLEESYRETLNLSNVKVRSNNLVGYYIEIPKRHSSAVPEGFIFKQTLVQSLRYTTAELLALEAVLAEKEDEVRRLRQTFFVKLVEQIVEYKVRLASIAEALAALDVTLGLSYLAEQAHYVRPEFSEAPGMLAIEEGRHPVIEVLLEKKGERFQPNPCDLTERKCLLLTGPNMAGKSTYLRQNALLILLAQMGSFVPAKRATLSLFDQIFTRIGAQDNLAQGESTFLCEMMESAYILNNATPQSFVILDEVGRGTAFSEGQAIARSVLEHLLEVIGCATLFTTHYYHLAHLDTYQDKLLCKTFQIIESGEELLLPHTLVEGITEKAYAFHTARKAGLPSSILHRASHYLENEHS